MTGIALRRRVVLGAALLPLLPTLRRARAATLPIPAGNRLGFDVMRKSTRLGTHVLSFLSSGDGLEVRVTVALTYDLGPITLYRYHHEATERWQAGRVVAVDARTDDNGTPYAMSARRGPQGLVVQGTMAPRYVAPDDALPATHWNRAELEGPWINTQDGRLMRPRVSPLGIERIATATGTADASGYRLDGDVDLKMWYDARGWAGLEFVKGGTPIRYLRQG